MDSASFSMPRWRYPISGTALTMISPSSSRRSRSTPCVAGCWGPILTVMKRVSAIGLISFFFGEPNTKRPVEVIPLPGEFLSQGMADKIIRKQDAPQIGMIAEGDPEHVVHLPFHPIRALP